MAAPTNVPSFAVASPSGFWFARSDLPELRFYATTPETFIVRLQTALRSQRYQMQTSYREGGPVERAGAGRAGTRFETQRFETGRWWGPVTNAALWRYIFEQAYGQLGSEEQYRQIFSQPQSDYVLVTNDYLDAIERVVAERRLNQKALEAAAFVWLHSLGGERAMPWSDFVRGRLYVDRRVVPPRYQIKPPDAEGPSYAINGSREFAAWNESQNTPPQVRPAEGSSPDSPGTPGTPGLPETSDGGKRPGVLGDLIPKDVDVPTPVLVAAAGVGVVATYFIADALVRLYRRRASVSAAPAQKTGLPVSSRGRSQ